MSTQENDGKWNWYHSRIYTSLALSNPSIRLAHA